MCPNYEIIFSYLSRTPLQTVPMTLYYCKVQPTYVTDYLNPMTHKYPSLCHRKPPSVPLPQLSRSKIETLSQPVRIRCRRPLCYRASCRRFECFMISDICTRRDFRLIDHTCMCSDDAACFIVTTHPPYTSSIQAVSSLERSSSK